MDPVLSIVLITVISLLTILLVAVGVQTFLILLDVKRSIKKLNQLFDDVQILTNSIARPVAGLTHLVEGVKNIKSIVDFASNLASKKEQAHSSNSSFSLAMEDEDSQLRERASILLGEEHESHPIHRIQEQGRRFFHRGGKPLTS